METKRNSYFGTTAQSIKTESFNVSLTHHPAKSNISLHAHEKPYLCLLAAGNYEEKSHHLDLIQQGEVIYRTANYEHANSFLNEDSVCLNIEIDDPDHFMDQNGVQFPLTELKQKGSIETYKLLFALKHDLPNDVLNICCYESMLSQISMINDKGDITWIKQVKEFIKDDPLAPISLEELSINWGLHPNYIVRKFKEVTGLKLSQYLTKTRLEYSIHSMIKTEDNMTKIALECGFYDQSHFNRNFKKYMDINPLLFRKAIKG